MIYDFVSLGIVFSYTENIATLYSHNLPKNLSQIYTRILKLSVLGKRHKALLEIEKSEQKYARNYCLFFAVDEEVEEESVNRERQ